MMNLYLSAAEYDYHTLLKVAEMAGLAGIIGFHEAGDGYLVTFPQGENVQALIDCWRREITTIFCRAYLTNFCRKSRSQQNK